MPIARRPARIYDFTAFSQRTPNAPPPGDRLDAQFKEHSDAIVEILKALEGERATSSYMDMEALRAEARAAVSLELQDLRQAVANAAGVADEARGQLAAMRAEAARAVTVADSAEARVAAAVSRVMATPLAPQARGTYDSFPRPPEGSSASQPLEASVPALGYGAGGFYAQDLQGATNTSADYAQVSIEWAEHLPDTIPPNILAINAITGEHYSSRWWALRAGNAFGMLAWWYMGAWPSPGPPSTPLTPTGQPIPPGAMYYDTTLGVMLVWNGSTWVPVAQGPGKATTSSLYYMATAGQTVFPLGTLDRNGRSFAFNQAMPEGLQAFVNGVRLEPAYDYTVDTVASSVTFLRGLTLNSLAIFDILTPVSQLTPSGTVNTVLVSPIVPDGVKTQFTGLTVAMNGHPVNVARNEELQVSLNGVIQQPGASYNAGAATITFSQAPEADANVFITWFGPQNP